MPPPVVAAPFRMKRKIQSSHRDWKDAAKDAATGIGVDPCSRRTLVARLPQRTHAIIDIRPNSAVDRGRLRGTRRRLKLQLRLEFEEILLDATGWRCPERNLPRA
jgi:hypothetical protein